MAIKISEKNILIYFCLTVVFLLLSLVLAIASGSVLFSKVQKVENLRCDYGFLHRVYTGKRSSGYSSIKVDGLKQDYSTNFLGPSAKKFEGSHIHFCYASDSGNVYYIGKDTWTESDKISIQNGILYIKERSKMLTSISIASTLIFSFFLYLIYRKAALLMNKASSS